MSSAFRCVLVVMAALSVACRGADSGASRQSSPTAPDSPPFSGVRSFRFDADTVHLAPGISFKAPLQAVDSQFRSIQWEGRVQWLSSSAAVTVDSLGRITARLAGSAVVTARLLLGAREHIATLRVVVLDDGLTGSIVLNATDAGWTPSTIRIRTGTTVTWRAGARSWSDVPQTHVFLLDAEYRETTRLELRSGSTTMSFTVPGLYRYCSGGCWDPPDFGMIMVY